MTEGDRRATGVQVAGFEVLEHGLFRGLQLGLRSGLAQRLKPLQQGGERWV